MQDRGYKKWAPFNSLINDKKVINELNQRYEIQKKPILSEDQIEFLNEKIFDAYTNHYKINLIIYKNMRIIKLVGFVNNINVQNKYIIFNNIHIYFNQLLKVTDFTCF